MHTQRIALAAFAGFIIGVCTGILYIGTPQTHNAIANNDATYKEQHIHAAFHIYKNGQRLDLTGSKYMEISPCDIEQSGKEPTTEEIQKDKAHLHDFVGDVVHSHVAPSTWGDLMQNLAVELQSPIGYINGELIFSILDKEIADYDQVLILDGSVDEDLIPELITKLPSLEHIREVSRSSESCGV